MDDRKRAITGDIALSGIATEDEKACEKKQPIDIFKFTYKCNHINIINWHKMEIASLPLILLFIFLCPNVVNVSYVEGILKQLCSI